MQQTMEPPVAAESNTHLEEVFKSIIEHAGARTVYGEPVPVYGKTVLPVATGCEMSRSDFSHRGSR
jgi:hypothetical protein